MSKKRNKLFSISKIKRKVNNLSDHFLIVSSFSFGFIFAFLAIFVTGSWIQSDVLSKAEIEKPPGTPSDFSSSIELEKKHEREVIGFLPSWTVAKKPNIDLDPLSQIVYFGFGITKSGEIIEVNKESVQVVEWAYFKSDYFKKLKTEANKTNTKVLISIKSFDNETIDYVISNEQSRNKLVNNIVKLVKDHELDGVNIDFEYVTDSGFPTVRYFAPFLEELSRKLKEENTSYIVSVDVNANALLKDPAYDMVKIGEVVDQVILMGYDFHRAASTSAGPVAPLQAEGEAPSVTKAIDALSGRVPSEKVILGVPFYGYEWQTQNKSFNSTTHQNTGALATYKRVKELLSSRSDITINWDKLSFSPWLVYEQSGAIKQIYYENTKSLRGKLDLTIVEELGGIAIWAIGYEGDNTELWEEINNTLHTQEETEPLQE